ncbi:MAG: GNAT family N-acetyltransferase [Spirochaetes bacterium]|nr:GNAT family N-acetyltransferase [Spirochaetota bacterium]
MIYYQTFYPEKMDGRLLDEGLARGWYRIAQSFITTDLITNGDTLVPVFWLRIDLGRYKPSRAAKRIAAKNAPYRLEIKPFAITEEIESLYQTYRASIDFWMSDSVAEYLLGNGSNNAFDSRLIELRDGERLIAVGYFDVGEKTNTGILHFYDPQYAAVSPGKYLFLAEIEYALQRGYDYYYMGYLCRGNAKFDYKLFADRRSTELFLRRRREWKPYDAMEAKINRWAPRITRAANRIYKLMPAGD